jgi:hypothetical protein
MNMLIAINKIASLIYCMQTVSYLHLDTILPARGLFDNRKYLRNEIATPNCVVMLIRMKNGVADRKFN